VGCFGAAAAASALLAPGDANTAQHALATAATFASGLQQALRSDAMTKALHAGHAAAVGIRAAQGAKHGITGVIDILEGVAGFGAALSDGPDWSRAIAGLGSDYNITRITQKNHGCCGHTFAAIDAVLELRSQYGLRPDQVRTIEVSTYQTALDVTGNFDPRTAFEGKFSLPYVVCNALVHGSVRLAAFEPERLTDPVVRNLMARLSLKADAELSKHFPTMRAARVVIVMTNGERHEHFAPYRKGDPEAPLSDRQLEDKFHELADPVLGFSHSTRLRDLVWNLDRIDVKDLNLASGPRIKS
jgi:2-methylcitrate dehydratase PrpD